MKLNLVIGLIALLITSILVIGAGCEQSQGTGSAVNIGGPQTYSVEIMDYAFSPQTLNIKTGDTVIWTNQDSIRHDIKSNDGSFYSIPLDTGEMYAFTFNTRGTFKYRCSLHPTMEGTIIVE